MLNSFYSSRDLISCDIDRILDSFFIEYNNKNIPIEVNFRELFPYLNNPDRASHLIHTYPAKLLVHIPFFFLNSSLFSKSNDIVLDPFCGSGTVLLEALISGKNSYGVDSNPLARLISIVKTTKYDIDKLVKYANNLEFSKISKIDEPSVVNLDYWFLPRIKLQLKKILAAIKKIEEDEYREFFLICFSNCVKKVSLADQKISVPVRIKKNHYPIGHPLNNKNLEYLRSLENCDVKKKFMQIVFENINRLSMFNSLVGTNNSQIISDNACNIINTGNTKYKGAEKESIDLIITSPPYAGAQKYIRASSLNLGWTELANATELRKLDMLSIGRENYVKSDYRNLQNTGIPAADKILKNIYSINPLRAHIASNYLVEMKIALKESLLTLKRGRYFVIVAANNQVCKKEFKTQEFLQSIMQDLGAKLVLCLIDDIKSYGLMTKRNKTADIISREWILVFQKPN